MRDGARRNNQVAHACRSVRLQPAHQEGPGDAATAAAASRDRRSERRGSGCGRCVQLVARVARRIRARCTVRRCGPHQLTSCPSLPTVHR